MVLKQPFHATNVRQHTVVVFLLCSYLSTYAQLPTHTRTFHTRILGEQSDILNHLQIQIVNPKLSVGIGRSPVASLNAIFCCLCPPRTYGSHTHKHPVSDRDTPIELTSRGARERLPKIDTYIDTPHQILPSTIASASLRVFPKSDVKKHMYFLASE